MNEQSEISQELFERIERYLEATMTSSERSGFEEEMNADPALRSEVSMQLQSMRAMQLAGFKERLARNQHLTAKHRRNYGWLAAAASVLILLGIGLYFSFFKNREPVYAAVIETDPGLPVPMSAVADYAFYDAMVDYKSENYGLAIEKWRPLLQANPTSDTLNYYLGSAFLNNKQFDQAIPHFDLVKQDTSSAFLYKSEYYRFVCAYYLKDAAYLSSISTSPNSPYGEKIAELRSPFEK